jgi:hypothetical protein
MKYFKNIHILYYIIIYIIIFIILSCKKNIQYINNCPETGLNPNSYYTSIDTFYYYRKLSLENGDKELVNRVCTFYFDNNKMDELYVYALIIANKFNNAQAYENLSTVLELHEEYLDDKTTKLSEYYLLKAYEIDSITYDFKVTEKYKNNRVPRSTELLPIIP